MGYPLRGVVAACLTPFAPDGSADFEALSAEIEFISSHVDAISIGAVEASEYRLLTEQQRRDLIKVGVEAVPRELPGIVGASAGTVTEVLAWTEEGAKSGAQYAQVLIPRNGWGGPLGGAELMSFFAAINKDTALPIVLYHNPVTGSDPDIQTLVELSGLDRVVAYKESSRDITKILRLIHEIDLAGHAAYLTTMQPMLMTLILGGSGATMPPPGTLVAAHIRDAYDAGDLEEAVRWQRLFAFFPGLWGAYGLANVMKAACRYIGLDVGAARAPVAPLPAAAERSLGEFIRRSGLTDRSPIGQDELVSLVRLQDG